MKCLVFSGNVSKVVKELNEKQLNETRIEFIEKSGSDIYILITGDEEKVSKPFVFQYIRSVKDLNEVVNKVDFKIEYTKLSAPELFCLVSYRE